MYNMLLSITFVYVLFIRDYKKKTIKKDFEQVHIILFLFTNKQDLEALGFTL